MKICIPLLAIVLFCSCSTQRQYQTENASKASQRTLGKKPSFGDHLKWITLGILEKMKEEQHRKPHGGVSINTPVPRFPPE